MVFRFGCALVLVVLVAMAGVALEKRSLELRRSISRQRYRMDVLQERRARLRLTAHELGSPLRTRETLAESPRETLP
jgi:cell division protein FtsB